MKIYKIKLSLILLTLFLLVINFSTYALTQGIYLTQKTLEDTERLKYLIIQARKTGINTFVIDFEKPTKQWEENVRLVKGNHIHCVARIVVFPNGGRSDQVMSKKYWKEKYKLMHQAVQNGASEIQLDYIRYNTKQNASSANALNIHKVIQFFKKRLAKQKIPLQVDVFGIASFGEAMHIGQNIKLFSTAIDALCPMVYPSHYEPYRQHATAPYETVYNSLDSIKKQFASDTLPFKLIPYIELSNYRFPLTKEKRLVYIRAQIKAVEAVKADGWYAWSPHNHYDNLFTVLSEKNKK